MLDIQFIRDNRELVAEKSKQKNIDVDINHLLALDEQRRNLVGEVESLRAQRNELAGQMKDQKPSEEQLVQGRQLKEQVSELESKLQPIEDAFTQLLKLVPNMPLEDVPVGASEDDNVVVKEVGVRPEFDFEPKTHWQLAEMHDLIDKERAAKVAGSRFAYIKGGLVQLQFAIVQFVIQTLGDERLLEQLIKENHLDIVAKPFTPILPPAMIRTPVFEAMDRLDPQDDRYRVGEVEDDLWLQGSAEHTLGSMYMDEILPADVFPIRYVGYSSSFRREAGTYGKDTEGIIRMHQFDKLEMEIFSTPETGLDEHRLMVAIQEYLVQQLRLPYRVIQKCTADIGKPNARGIDIDVWMPGQGKYRETHTADYMTDYQARRLKTRVRRSDGVIDLVHTNDATAFALGRIMVAIMENNQTHDGHIWVPDVLRPFMGGKEWV
jgi:seryl-tRNA synthetase